MNRSPSPKNSPDIQELLQNFRAGDPGVSDQLVSILTEQLKHDMANFLGPSHPETEDIIQETLMATLNYLTRDVEFQGDLIGLAVTIARNRGRDLLRRNQRWTQTSIEPLAEWLESPQKNALEMVEASERRALLQKALDSLPHKCNNLLRLIYLEEIDTEEITKSMGLKSRQVVYYRKAACLRRIKKIFHSLLDRRSIHVTRGAKSREESGN